MSEKVSPNTPGWKLTHVEPPNGHGCAYDYFACPRCGMLFIVPIEHECVFVDAAGKVIQAPAKS